MGKLLRRLSVPALMGVVLALNGFLNLATGLLPIFRIRAGLEEVPEYLRISPAVRTSSLLSVFLGILLIAIGKGLWERRRRSWWLAVVVLVALMANNLYRGTTPQTALLSGALLLGLLAFRRRFWVTPEVRLGYAQVVALVSVIFALAYGIVGSYLLRQQFQGIRTWTDAVYFTFVTYSTLGYGDVLPVTPDAKIFAVTMIPIGLASLITAFTALLGPAIESRLKGVLSIMERFQNVKGHVVLCGYSSVAESVIDELQERDAPYVIVETREDLVAQLRSKGHDVLLGDPSRKETLQRANLREACAVISAFDSDSLNVLIAVTARELREALQEADFRILVRVEDEENIPKAERVGADEVISPSTMGGRQLAVRALGGGERDVR